MYLYPGWLHMVDPQRGAVFNGRPPLLILALAPEPESGTKKLSGTRRITFSITML